MHAVNGYRQTWMTSLFRQSDVYLNAAMFASDRTSPLERVMVQLLNDSSTHYVNNVVIRSPYPEYCLVWLCAVDV